jgi:uncharacterized Ntn-hydrolase superfamily protein
MRNAGLAAGLPLLLMSAASSPLPPDPGPLAATYSIVARDPSTGEIGVAVQSHYFSVGSAVPWAEPGVGAVATQAFAEVGYGPRGLALLREGSSASEALAKLTGEDAGRELRQVAIVDGAGRVAVHTGRSCIAAAGHVEGRGYSVQGNMLRSDAVWKAMGRAYETAGGDLAERLLAALEAAEGAGGDIRGRQSAALLVVSGKRTERPWEERRVELRIEDHPDPLVELRRLLALARAYRLMSRASAVAASGELDAARELFLEAQKIHPDNPELSFWAGVTLARAGRLAEALDLLRAAYRADPGWRELLRRLPPSGLLPADPELLERLTSER